MRKPLHSSLALRGTLLISLAALSLVAGCGNLRSLYSHVRTESKKGQKVTLTWSRKLRQWYGRAFAASDHRHKVTITWTASNSIVAGYNVYRVSPSGDAVKLSTGIVSETSYVDTNVEPGKSYSYYVKSVDFRGKESPPSEKITVTVPAATGSAARQ
jgi:hypothetical protein